MTILKQFHDLRSLEFLVHTFFRSMQHLEQRMEISISKLNHLSTSSNLHYQQELIKINYHKEIHPYKYKKMSTQILFQPSHCYLKLYHHPWGNEDLAHLLVAPDSHHSPVTHLSQLVCLLFWRIAVFSKFTVRQRVFL